jgi:metal-responsive CopG/Arc/MetJ family transcriptional regulator
MNKYQGISLPKKLLNKIEETIEEHGFTNKTEFIRQAIRNELRRVTK